MLHSGISNCVITHLRLIIPSLVRDHGTLMLAVEQTEKLSVQRGKSQPFIQKGAALIRGLFENQTC